MSASVYNRKFLLIACASLLVGGALITSGPVAPSLADTNTLTTLTYTIQTAPGGWQHDRYSELLSSLRNAAGFAYRDGVLQTQNQDAGIIAVNFTNGLTGMTVYMEPRNLYVRGFSTWGEGDQRLYQFNDADYRLDQRMRASGVAVPAQGVINMPFSSHYIDITRVAQRTRTDMPLNWASFIGAYNGLVGQTRENLSQPIGQRDTARALLFFTQFLSEAARFHPVAGVMAATQSGNEYQQGIPAIDQAYENNWGRLSRFGLNVSQNPSTPGVNVSSMGSNQQFRTWTQLSTVLSILLRNPNDITGDPKTSEL